VTVLLEDWPAAPDWVTVEHNLELRWVTESKVSLGRADGQSTAYLPVANTAGHRRIAKIDSEIEVDFAATGLNARQVGTARTPNTGWDIHAFVKNDLTQIACVAVPHYTVPAAIAGWGVFKSGGCRYVCPNGEDPANPGVYDRVTMFGNSGKRTNYRSCGVTMQIVAGRTATVRTVIPFSTVPTVCKAQVPKTAKTVWLRVTARNPNNNDGDFKLFRDAVCNDPLFVLEEISNSAPGDSRTKELFIPIPIGEATTDTAVYSQWDGAPGNPSYDVFVLGYDL